MTLREEIAALRRTGPTFGEDTDSYNAAIRHVLAILDRIADDTRGGEETPSEERPARRELLSMADWQEAYNDSGRYSSPLVAMKTTLAIVESIDALTAAVREARR